MKIGNVESKNLKAENLRKCTCNSKPMLFPELGAYSVMCSNNTCKTMTAPYETAQDAFNAWENKILM